MLLHNLLNRFRRKLEWSYATIGPYGEACVSLLVNLSDCYSREIMDVLHAHLRFDDLDEIPVAYPNEECFKSFSENWKNKSPKVEA